MEHATEETNLQMQMRMPAQVPSLPTILPLNQRLEVRQPGEDWTGLADSAQRRRLQNRLHQRAWRRRQARQGNHLVATHAHTGKSASPGELADHPTAQSGKSASSAPASTSSDGSSARTCGMHAATRTEVLARFEEAAYQEYLRRSPRTDLLLTLVKFNVFRALLDNTRALGFTLDWLEDAAVSPFSQGRSMDRDDGALVASACPKSLRPTPLQRLVAHHPWIDILPIPRMRDNILRAGGSFDQEALCGDLVEIRGSLGERSGLITWGAPWDVRNWEVAEPFLQNWGWVIEGCWELFSATNYWRAQRGEEKLFPDTAHLPRENRI